MDLKEFTLTNGSLLIPKDLAKFVVVKKNVKVKKCAGCGKSFYSTNGNRRFCPPTETKRSQCEMKYANRVKRARKKAAMGVNSRDTDN